jgi:hypothetical protein
MNNITLKLPSPQQHQRVFLDDLIERYKLKLITAADYILSLVSIYRAKGQKLTIPSAKSFYEQFKIPKSTFYRALKRLESLPLGFHWEPTGGICIWREAEDTDIPPAPEKEPTYTKLQDLPLTLRNQFEIFVKKEWQKLKGEKINSFHRFVENRKDFQNWWFKFLKFQEQTAAAEPEPSEPEAEPSKRFCPIPDKFKGLFNRKPT